MIKRIQVGKNTRVLETDKIEIDGLAVRNDNAVDILRFEFDEFVDGQATMLTDIRGEDDILAPFVLEKNSEDKFYETKITKELLVNPILTIQLQIVDGEKVWHSKQACLLVHNSLSIGEGKMPSGIDNWLEQADNKLNEADKKIEEIENTIKEFKEKDPTIPEHIKNITEEDIAKWNSGTSSESGTTNYSDLENKPSINGVELNGNKSLADLNIKQDYTASDIKFSDGETFQEKYNSGELKGEKGDKGDTGATGPAGKDGTNGTNGTDGKTPVKGTDYFTEADKQEMVNLVLQALPDGNEVSY